MLPGLPAWGQGLPASAVDRSVMSFDRFEPFGEKQAERLAKARALGRFGKDSGLIGSFDYDFTAAAAGWYELLVQGSGGGVEFILDPDHGGPGLHGDLIAGVNGSRRGFDKIGNLWLEQGAHTLRLRRRAWSGFPDAGRVLLRPSDASLAKSLRITPGERSFHRLGRCEPLVVASGRRDVPARLTILVRTPATVTPGASVQRIELVIPASAGLLRQTVALPCSREGVHAVTFAENGVPVDPFELRSLEYEVVDVDTPAAPLAGRPLSLVEEIDASTREPDFSGAGDDRRVRNGKLAYRESGDRGWIPFQRLPEAVRALAPEPGWFAYRLKPLRPQQPYLVEVEFPDDAERSFAVALRESETLAYPLSSGADTGREYGLSNGLQRLRLWFWPRTPNPRIVVLNALDGKRAAVSKISVFRVDDGAPSRVPPPAAPSAGVPRRQYLSWYEEGTNFSGLYGAPDGGFGGTRVAIDRWAQLLKDAGGTTLMPSAAVYSFSLYPAANDPVFAAAPGDDVLRRLLLAAEKRGLQVIPELHPRADQLGFAHADAPDPKPQLLVSRDGKTNPAYRNPLFPPNQDWYVELAGEIADRYRDSPALQGIALRLMPWANAALNNFVSLDWGYDDASVRQFDHDTAAHLPARLLRPIEGRDGLAAERYGWLMKNAREAWIAWRCERVAQLHGRVLDRIRRARPDLRLFASVFAWGPQGTLEELRQAGIDPARLQRIDGLTLINAQYTYGRRDPDAAHNERQLRRLTDPGPLAMLAGAPGQAHFLTSAAYFEATDAIVKPERLGFDKATRSTWMSTAASPAGRNALQRLALPLARTDAQMLGDGGNMYTLGPPALQEFLAEYTLLPAEAFVRRSAAGDAVAVWSRAHPGAQPDGELFYVVNTEARAVRKRLAFEGRGDLLRLRSGQPLALLHGTHELELQAYELVVLRATGSLRLR